MFFETAFAGWFLTVLFFLIGTVKRNGFFLLLSGGLMVLMAAVVAGEGIDIVSGIDPVTGLFLYETAGAGNDFLLQFVVYLSVPFGVGLMLFGMDSIRARD